MAPFVYKHGYCGASSILSGPLHFTWAFGRSGIQKGTIRALSAVFSTVGWLISWAAVGQAAYVRSLDRGGSSALGRYLGLGLSQAIGDGREAGEWAISQCGIGPCMTPSPPSPPVQPPLHPSLFSGFGRAVSVWFTAEWGLKQPLALTGS